LLSSNTSSLGDEFIGEYLSLQILGQVYKNRDGTSYVTR